MGVCAVSLGGCFAISCSGANAGSSYYVNEAFPILGVIGEVLSLLSFVSFSYHPLKVTIIVFVKHALHILPCSFLMIISLCSYAKGTASQELASFLLASFLHI